MNWQAGQRRQAGPQRRPRSGGAAGGRHRAGHGSGHPPGAPAGLGADPEEGRRLPVNVTPPYVTTPANRRSNAGPIPGTRLNSAVDAYRPRAARSATIRRASDGPTPGNVLSSAVSAWFTSTGPRGSRGNGRCAGSSDAAACGGDVLSDARRPRAARAPERLPARFPARPRSVCACRESTASSWCCRASRSAAVGGRTPGRSPSPSARAPAPVAASTAKKPTAFRSAEVMAPRYASPAELCASKRCRVVRIVAGPA